MQALLEERHPNHEAVVSCFAKFWVPEHQSPKPPTTTKSINVLYDKKQQKLTAAPQESDELGKLTLSAGFLKGGKPTSVVIMCPSQEALEHIFASRLSKLPSAAVAGTPCLSLLWDDDTGKNFRREWLKEFPDIHTICVWQPPSRPVEKLLARLGFRHEAGVAMLKITTESGLFGVDVDVFSLPGGQDVYLTGSYVGLHKNNVWLKANGNACSLHNAFYLDNFGLLCITLNDSLRSLQLI
jgi:hypothetical protein